VDNAINDPVLFVLGIVVRRKIMEASCLGCNLNPRPLRVLTKNHPVVSAPLSHPLAFVELSVNWTVREGEGS